MYSPFEMMRRVLLIWLCSLWILALSAQERYSFDFRGITIDQALMQIEEAANVSMIYNPKEVAANKRITLSISNRAAADAVRLILGADYRVLQKNGILTIRYSPQPKPMPEPVLVPNEGGSNLPASEVEETEDVAAFLGGSELQVSEVEAISGGSNLPVEEEPAEIALVPDDQPASASVESAPVPVELQEKELEKEKKKHAFRRRDFVSPHRLGLSSSVAYAGIAQVSVPATVFEIQYAYFFTQNWGVSLSAAIDCYGQLPKEKEPQLLAFAMPLMVRMDYPLTELIDLVGGAGATIGLPIEGPYCTDESGARYARSLMYGITADAGISFQLNRHLCLGTSLYAQSIVGSSGEQAAELTGSGIYPWQIGMKLTLWVNCWNR